MRTVRRDDSPKWGYGTGDMATDVVELLEQIGWTKDVHLVGLSMGGMITQRLFLERPDIFASLTLAVTSAGRFQFQWAGVSTLFGNLRVKDQNEIVKRLAYANYTQNWLEAKSEDLQYDTNLERVTTVSTQRGKLIRPQPIQGVLGHMYATLRHSLTAAELESIRTSGTPVMIIVGSEDKFISVSNSYYLKDALGAKHFEIFEDTGHALQNQRHERFSLLVERFWREAEEKWVP